MQSITTIIWDWNGTLLDDTEIGIESINVLLKERNLPLLSREYYLNVFGFPVIEYYKKIGFDLEKEPFEIPAHQFIDVYSSKLKDSGLHNQVEEVLGYFQQKGLTQVILSASEQNKLESAVEFFGISKYFEALAGLDHHFATSKTDIGKALLEQKGIRPSNACLVGDTTHDYDVAREIGCECILVGNGHQHINRLKATGAKVVGSITELTSIFQNANPM